MPDKPDNLDPHDSDNIDGNSSSLSKKDNAEMINSIINAMDKATSKAIDPEMLKTFSNTMDGTLSRAVDPEMLKAFSKTMDATLSRAIDPEMMKNLVKTLDIVNFKGVDLKSIENVGTFPKSDFSKHVSSEITMPISKSYAQLSYEEQQEYHEQSLKLLKEISKNTTNLSTIVDLIIDNNNNQEQILLIISEILSIATAKTEEELNDKFMKVIKNINSGIEFSVQTAKLIQMAITVVSIVSPMIANLGK